MLFRSVSQSRYKQLPILNVVDEIGNLLDAHPVTYQPYPIQNKELGYLVATDNIQQVALVPFRGAQYLERSRIKLICKMH